MSAAEPLLRVAREALLLAVLVSAPPILASLAVGLLVGALQAVTQLQEPTLTFAPKLVAVGLSLVAAGPWIGAQLVRFTRAVLELIPALGRS